MSIIVTRVILPCSKLDYGKDIPEIRYESWLELFGNRCLVAELVLVPRHVKLPDAQICLYTRYMVRNRTRKTLFWFLLLAGTTASPQLPEKKISFQSPGARMEKLLPELSKAVGIPLVDSPSIKDDVLCLRVKDIPASEVMRRVADTLNATWRKEDGFYRLVRTADQRRGEEELEYRTRLKKIVDDLNKRRETIAKEQPFDANAKAKLAQQYKSIINTFDPTGGNWGMQSQKIRDLNPGGRGVNRIITMLPAETLANLNKGSRIVFSTNPNSMQVRMPDEMAGYVSKMIKDVEDWREEMTSQGIANPMRGNTTYILFPELWDQSGQGNTGAKRKTVLAQVALVPQTWGDSCSIAVRSYDDKGGQTFQNDTYFSPDQGAGPTTPAPKTDVKNEPDIDVAGEYFDKNELTDSGLRALSTPVDVDPLSVVVGKALGALADYKQTNLVAYLPDELMSLQYIKKIKPSQLLSALGNYSSVSTEGNWMVIRPKAPAKSRSQRSDRKAMGSILNRYHGVKNLTLEQQAEVVCSYSKEATLAPTLYRLFKCGDSMNTDALRLYGALTPPQRTFALKGIPFRSMSEAAQREISELVFGGQWFSMQYDASKDPQARKPDGQIDYSRQNLYYSGFYQEPTNALPDGIPANALFTITDSASESAFRVATDPRRPWLDGEALTADQIGQKQYQHEHMEHFPWMKDQMENDPPLNLVQFGKKRDVQMRLEFAPPISTSWSLQQKNPASMQTFTMSQLPPDFAKKVKEAYDQQAKIYSHMPIPDMPASAPSGRP